MNNDVHFAALRAAAKVAFSMALLNGCSSSGGEKGGDEATNESSIISSDTAANGEASKEPCSEKDAGTAKKTCAQVLASAFPTPGEYQWEPVAQSAEVVACCDEELTTHLTETAYRWECCVAYDPTADAGSREHGFACTPWGPPVPPSMKRARRANPAIAAWIVKAVA